MAVSRTLIVNVKAASQTLERIRNKIRVSKYGQRIEMKPPLVSGQVRCWFYLPLLLPVCYCLPNATTHCLALLAKNGGSYPLKFSVTGIWNSIVQFDFHTAKFLWTYNHYNNYNRVSNCTALNRAVPPKWDLPVRSRDHFLPSSAVLLPHYVHACRILKYFADF